jgi:hypothetical protein
MDYEGSQVKGVWADENLARKQVEELKNKNVYCDSIEIVHWEGATPKRVAWKTGKNCIPCIKQKLRQEKLPCRN